MKIIILVMTGKSEEESTEEDIDKTCDVLEKILYTKYFEKFEWEEVKIMANGTGMVLLEKLVSE